MKTIYPHRIHAANRENGVADLYGYHSPQHLRTSPNLEEWHREHFTETLDKYQKDRGKVLVEVNSTSFNKE